MIKMLHLPLSSKEMNSIKKNLKKKLKKNMQNALSAKENILIASWTNTKSNVKKSLALFVGNAQLDLTTKQTLNGTSNLMILLAWSK